MQASRWVVRICPSQFLSLRSFPQGEGLGYLEIPLVFIDLIHRCTELRGRELAESGLGSSQAAHRMRREFP